MVENHPYLDSDEGVDPVQAQIAGAAGERSCYQKANKAFDYLGHFADIVFVLLLAETDLEIHSGVADFVDVHHQKQICGIQLVQEDQKDVVQVDTYCLLILENNHHLLIADTASCHLQTALHLQILGNIAHDRF